MMRREGGSRRGEDETVMVASDRRIMMSGRTERGERVGWLVMESGTAMVFVRRSEVWIRRREARHGRRARVVTDVDEMEEEVAQRRGREAPRPRAKLIVMMC